MCLKFVLEFFSLRKTILFLPLLSCSFLFAQTPSNINYPIASCIGPSCPGVTTIPTHVTASYFDTINEVLYIGGKFNDVGGNARPGLAAIDLVTGNLLPWSPTVNNGTVCAIAKSGDTVLIGGTFTQVNSTTRNRIAALSASTGNLLTTFATGTTVSTDTVMSLLALGGKVYAGGKFTNIASAARTNLARFSINGTLDSWTVSPAVTGPVKMLRWYAGNIVAVTENPSTYVNEISAITTSAGIRTLRASTDPGERITGIAMRGNVAFFVGPFFTINAISRTTSAACDMSTGTLTGWNPQPAFFNFDTRSKFSLAYYRDSLYIGVFDVSSNQPAYHKIYVSHYTAGNLRVLKTYQSNLTGLNGYFNDGLLTGNARLLEIERFAQHTAFPNGSINCRFWSYCLRPPNLPGPWIADPFNACPGDTNIVYSVQHLSFFSSYNWQSMSADIIPAPNFNSASVDFATTFSASAALRVYGVTSCGTSTPQYRSVTISPLVVPNASAGNDDTLNCTVSQTTLHGSSSTSGATFLWTWSSGSSNTDSILVSAAGTYVLTVHAPNGCWKYDTALVSIDTIRPAINPFSFIPSLTCRDTIVILDADSLYPADSLSWLGPGLLSPQNPAGISQQGNFLLHIISRSNGCENSDTVFVPQNITPPSANSIAPDTVITCSTPAVTLDAFSPDSNTIFQWRDTANLFYANPFSVSIPGVYQLVATDTSNGCINAANLVFITSWLTPPGINPLPDSVFLNCSYDSLTIIANSLTSGTTWSWNGPNYSSVSDSAVISQSGFYFVTATHPQNGCTSADSVYAGFQAVLDVDASNDTAICPGSGAVLQVFPLGGTAPFAFSWSNGAGSGSPVTVFPTDTLLYIVSAIDATGCTGVDTVVVSVPDTLRDSIVSFQPCDPLQPTGQIQVHASGGVQPYQFSLDNGLTWNSSGVFPNLAYGSYTILIRDTLGCIRTTTGIIDTNSLSPQPDFLLSTSPQQTDTIVVVDISNPRPDSVSWDFPLGTIVVDSNRFAPVIICGDTGNFTITMHAFYGSCEVIYSRAIHIHPFDSQSATAWNTNGIDSLAIFPNPNTGTFNFFVQLGAKQNFVILVYDAASNERTRVQVSDADSWNGQISVPNPAPGNYIIRVVAEFDAAELLFVISQ